MGLICESNMFGSTRPLSESCDFSCRDATGCMFKLVGDCLNCEKVSCENCIHFIKDMGCELQEKEERTKSFFTELIMEQNEQK